MSSLYELVDEAEKLRIEGKDRIGLENKIYVILQSFQFQKSDVEHFRELTKKEHKYAQYIFAYIHTISDKPNYMISFQYCRDSMEHGVILAENDMGYHYEQGLFTPEDISMAIGYYTSAGNKGLHVAMTNIAQVYYKRNDLDNGHHWISKILLEKDFTAIRCLGTYLSQIPIEIYPMLRDAYLKDISNNDYTYANNLALMLQNGYGGDVDLKEAARLFTIASDKGSYIAMYNLACMYRDGEGVSSDINKAFELFHKALLSDPDRTTITQAIQDILSDEMLTTLLISHDALKNKVKELELANAKLSEDVDRLQTELDYRPDGAGYVEAKSHFDEHKDKLG